jgi:hypothetical protein
MKSKLTMALAALAIAGIGVVAASEAQAACMRISAQGEGLTKELATEMAKINLDFAIMLKGAKSSGQVRTTCAPGVLMLTTCTAKQRACT